MRVQLIGEIEAAGGGGGLIGSKTKFSTGKKLQNLEEFLHAGDKAHQKRA